MAKVTKITSDSVAFKSKSSKEKSTFFSSTAMLHQDLASESDTNKLFLLLDKGWIRIDWIDYIYHFYILCVWVHGVEYQQYDLLIFNTHYGRGEKELGRRELF